MSRYIKKVNWPWIEIESRFAAAKFPMIINAEDISAVGPYNNARYRNGVRMKDGTWIEDMFDDEALRELQEVLMEKRAPKTSFNFFGGLPVDNDVDLIHESQSIADWLEEEGQI